MSTSRFPSGGLIDRERRLAFTFDERSYGGYAGDTLASALLANNVRPLARSFKYHRKRSLLTGGASEPNALVTLGEGPRREPNLRASMIELAEGMRVESQNRWPSLDYDIGALNGWLSPFIGAGFYYKTFMWPAALWEKLYEPVIRRAAGLGRANHLRDTAEYEKRWAHCDLLVIGAGPTGLMAALTAARAGARVILCDEMPAPGGRLLMDRVAIGDTDGPGFARTVLDELSGFANVRLLPRTTVVGWYDSGVFGAVERPAELSAGPAQRLWRIVARRAVLASGAEERPLVYGNNDLPGTLTASAMRGLAHQHAIRPGHQLAVFTTGSSGHETAGALEALGVSICAVIDSRTEIPEGDGAASAGVRLLQGHVLADAFGSKRVSGGRMIDRVTGEEVQLNFDCLAVSGGYSPIVHLACQRGDRPVWDEEKKMFLPPAPRDGLATAGSAAGEMTLHGCLAAGARAAGDALEALGLKVHSPDLPPVREAAGGTAGSSALWHVKEARYRAFVDFQNDVTVEDLALAVREGYGHVELAKRYTTNGMATDQGKTSNVNAIGILAELQGKSPAEIGTTTFRPFYTPVTMGALAGPNRGAAYRPVRRSPLHAWSERLGAVFVEAGPWMRPVYFPHAGDDTWLDACNREVLAVRSGVGICDASTLGKIDVAGSDAATFLDRVYTGRMSTLPMGKARYGLMLREDGHLMDDGTVSRLGNDHFLVTTTTGAAGEVMAHLEFCAQALWPQLDVQLTSVTDQWAQMAIAGPAARQVISRIIDGDLSEEAFPFLAAREVKLHSGQRARLFRISFSGELGFELAVPARMGVAVAEALMEAGAPFGVVPYGLEALNVLRIEKGFVTHSEIDGRTTPEDLGLGKLVNARKDDFIGKAMLACEGLSRGDRGQLVGLMPIDPAARLLAGAHLLDPGAVSSMEADQGHVSSACWSPHLESPIALALLNNGRARTGETLRAWDLLRGYETEVRVVDLPFLAAAGDAAEAEEALPSVTPDGTVPAPFIDGEVLVRETRLAQLPFSPVCLLRGRAAEMAALCEVAAKGDGVARAVAPGEVLAVGEAGESAESLIARLKPAAGAYPLDLSDARVRFELGGPEAAEILATLTAVDLDLAYFGLGASAPTLFDQVAGQLTRLAEDRYEIMTFSTFGQDLAQSLMRALRSSSET